MMKSIWLEIKLRNEAPILVDLFTETNELAECEDHFDFARYVYPAPLS